MPNLESLAVRCLVASASPPKLSPADVKRLESPGTRRRPAWGAASGGEGKQ